VPAGQGSKRFGHKILRELHRLGYLGQVGVSDDRFTAMVAARTAHQDVTVIKRGLEAEYLADKPIGLLPLDAEVTHLLEAAGVDTLGKFARLPPPTVDRPRDRQLDYRRLAAGRGPRGLRAASWIDPRSGRVTGEGRSAAGQSPAGRSPSEGHRPARAPWLRATSHR